MVLIHQHHVRWTASYWAWGCKEGRMDEQVKEAWGSGGPYERYVGRWSRPVAREFLPWLGVPSGRTWGDVGCGTGALVECILAVADPRFVFAIDRSDGFLATAQAAIPDQRVQFELADATALPWADVSCDVTVSGLVLNFVPDAGAMLREMVRVTRPRGKVAAYLWDYSGGMEMMRQFWDAAIAVSPEDAALDQAERFPLCQPQPLEALFRDAGLRSVSVRAIDIPTVFQDFDDYWLPFLGMQGAAPTYLASLDDKTRAQIRELLKARLPAAADGSIALTARAWAVQGSV
jgi:SAM-dependent methyltransferase